MKHEGFPIRRRVLLGAGGSLLLVCASRRVRADAASVWQALATLELHSNGLATLWLRKIEMGQGAHAGVLAVVVSALDLPAERFDLRQAPSRPRFGNLVTGGSFSAAGAARFLAPQVSGVRLRLMQAAAARWGVGLDACRTAQGQVVHAPSGRRLKYEELLRDAVALPEPKGDALAQAAAPAALPSEVGLAAQALHAPGRARDVVTGERRYGIDRRAPQDWVAVVARAPALNARMLSFDDAACRTVPGFERCVVVRGNQFPAQNHVRDGVAVVARNTWAALQARQKLVVRWDESHAVRSDSAALYKALQAAANQAPAWSPQAEAGLAAWSWQITLPAYPHLPMEPPNAWASASGEGAAAALHLVSGTQRQTRLHDALVKEQGWPREQVQVESPHLGGGFGRKLEVDYALEAALVARELGRPVQLLWTRDDDIRFGIVRPPSAHRIDLLHDARGGIAHWHHVFAGESVTAQQEPADMAQDAGDWTMRLPMLAFPYAVKSAEHIPRPLREGIPVGWWRGTAWTQVGVAVECALNAFARHTRQDPLGLRLRHLAGQGTLQRRHGERIAMRIEAPRLIQVLQRVAQAARWPVADAAPACGFYDCDGTYVAVIAQTDRERRRIIKLWISVDCGRVLTPDVVRQQIESSVVFALTALKSDGLHWEQGRVRESSLAELPLLTLAEWPQVDIDVVPSDADVSGIGEPVVPVLLAAAMSALGRGGKGAAAGLR